MNFASVRQIAVMILLTAGLLFGIDRVKNPHLEEIPGETRRPSVAADKPMIRLWLNDLRCGGCLGGVQASLSQVRWLEAPRVLPKLPPLETSEETPGVANGSQQQVVVDMPIPEQDIQNVDFVTVLAALRKAGISAAQMEFSGVPHYRLEAELTPLCSVACVHGTREAMDDLVRASKPKGWFRWLDSYSVDGVNEALVIYPRIGATVDVMEVFGAINTIGFETAALTVHVQGAK